MSGRLRACLAGLALGALTALGFQLVGHPLLHLAVEPQAAPALAATQAVSASARGEQPQSTPPPEDAEPAPAEPVRLAFAGDVFGLHGVADALARGDNPFAAVSPLLAAADLTVVNLETAVAESGIPEADKSFTFNAPLGLLDALVAAGVDVVSLANNHALDYGTDALVETIARAGTAGLRVVGAGPDSSTAYAPAVVEVRDLRVAVVGVSRVLPRIEWSAGESRPGIASAYDEEAAVAAVRAAAEIADYVVVAVHWGKELAACPDPVQRQLAEAFVDAGAHVVAGHHPHVLQGIERHAGGLVAYSLGNFAFSARGADTSRTGVLTVTLTGDDLQHSFHPAVIAGSLPVPVAGAEAEDVQAVIAARSPGGSAGCSFD